MQQRFVNCITWTQSKGQAGASQRQEDASSSEPTATKKSTRAQNAKTKNTKKAPIVGKPKFKKPQTVSSSQGWNYNF
jgi:hypothetical protein